MTLVSTPDERLDDLSEYEYEPQYVLVGEPEMAYVEQGEAGLDLSPEVMAAYNAPFHTPEAKAGARQWPSLVPTDPDMEGADFGVQTVEVLGEWEKPAFVLYSDQDPITHGVRDDLRELILSTSHQLDVWIEGAGHFLQEEAGETVADSIVAFADRT